MSRKLVYDIELVNELVDKYTVGQVAPSAVETAWLAHRDLWDLDARLDERARPALESLSLQALTQVAGRRIKKTGQVLVSWNGTVVKMPERMAVRDRDEDGVPGTERQFPLIVEMTWAQVEEKREWLAKQANTLYAEVAAYDQILALRMLYPQANTPLEACELAGLDPESIAL